MKNKKNRNIVTLALCSTALALALAGCSSTTAATTATTDNGQTGQQQDQNRVMGQITAIGTDSITLAIQQRPDQNGADQGGSGSNDSNATSTADSSSTLTVTVTASTVINIMGDDGKSTVGSLTDLAVGDTVSIETDGQNATVISQLAAMTADATSGATQKPDGQAPADSQQPSSGTDSQQPSSGTSQSPDVNSSATTNAK